LVAGPRRVPANKTDRKTNRQSYYNFDQLTKPRAWGYNWATLFLGEINTGTWPSNLGESQISDSKIWS
jgi:hypothetical protein